MLATVQSSTLSGLDGSPVAVEVHVSDGLPGFAIVGTPDTSCREARDRVRAAIISSGLDWPMRRITVNLAPSDVPKVGAGLDLPIAVGILAASEQIDGGVIGEFGMVGELGLDGSVRAVAGALPLIDAIDTPRILVPAADAAVARLVAGARCRPIGRLRDFTEFVRDGAALPLCPPAPPADDPVPVPDLADVRGQPAARWALEVAAAGGHHILLVGPPGAGKTMLARRLPGILPDLDARDGLEVTRIHSAAGLPLPPSGLIRRPPWRAPHHSASMAALVGGGSNLAGPGEVSLATRGVLFLDELGEFSPKVLDALRQPLEEGRIRVARTSGTVDLPADVLLVVAMNPCPCGEGGSAACTCPPSARSRYSRRLSGPLLDRLDLLVHVERPNPEALMQSAPARTSAEVAESVAAVRRLSAARGFRTNAELDGADLDEHAPLDEEATDLLRMALAAGRLSARGLRRVRCVARTVRDLDDGGPVLRGSDVSSALAIRARHDAFGPCDGR